MAALSDQDQPMPIPKLTAVIGLFTAVAIPLAAVLWTTLNDLLSGKVRLVQLLVAIPVLVAFVLLLIAWGRVVQQAQAKREDAAMRAPERST